MIHLYALYTEICNFVTLIYLAFDLLDWRGNVWFARFLFIISNRSLNMTPLRHSMAANKFKKHWPI